MGITEQGTTGEPEGEGLNVVPEDDEGPQNVDRVLVGGKDFVYTQIGQDLTDLVDGTDESRKAFDLVRVYVGTLLKTDQVSLLLGAGCSLDAGGVLFGAIPYEVEHGLLTQGLTEDGQSEPWLTLFYSIVEKCFGGIERDPQERAQRIDLIESCIKAEGRDSSSVKTLVSAFQIPTNFEVFLNRLYTWLAGLVGNKMDVASPVDGHLVIQRDDLQSLLNHLIAGLTQACVLPLASCQNPLLYHRLLIQRLLTRPLNLRRVALFTLNYDTLLEQAMDGCGVVALDGFIGTLRRVFRPESYDHDLYFPGQTTEGRVHRLDRVMHLCKLHGSVSWRTQEPDWDNPYGLYSTFPDDCAHSDVLIYPTPLKQGETLGMPYSEMFRRFATSIVRPQSVLFVMGYGFGDDHVNAIIRQALAIPSFTLVIVDPDPGHPFVRQLVENCDKRVCIIKGPRIGTFTGFVDKLLPDLDEERVLKDVVKTYKALDPKLLADGAPETGEGDGQ